MNNLRTVTAKRNPLQLRPNNRKAVFIQRYASTVRAISKSQPLIGTPRQNLRWSSDKR